MTPEVEALDRFYAAINRNDIDTVIRHLHPDIVRVEPEGFPGAGTYRGTAALREQFQKARDTWAEGSCEPERFLQDGDTVVAYVHVNVRLKGADDWIRARFADGFVFRDGTIVEFRTFPDRAAALAWAGIEDPVT